jgi:hypothetical protein
MFQYHLSILQANTSSFNTSSYAHTQQQIKFLMGMGYKHK